MTQCMAWLAAATSLGFWYNARLQASIAVSAALCFEGVRFLFGVSIRLLVVDMLNKQWEGGIERTSLFRCLVGTDFRETYMTNNYN